MEELGAAAFPSAEGEGVELLRDWLGVFQGEAPLAQFWQGVEVPYSLEQRRAVLEGVCSLG